MNSRERMLATLVGALLLLVCAYFVWSRVTDSIDLRKNRLRASQQELDAQDRTLELASRASRDLKQLQLRSLPKDLEQANSVYNEWLLALVDEVEFRDPSVTAADRRIRSGYFDRLRFDVEADATIDQFAAFLSAFYLSGDLHRIESMTVKPIRDSRYLDVKLTIEAISLPGSTRSTVGDVASPEVTAEMVVAAEQAIQNRALFFPLNIAPSLSSIADQRIERGRRWRYEATGSDPDPWDALEFELKSEAPAGMRFSSTDDRAVFSWTPRELGEHTIRVAVKDTGSPRRETIREFKLTVVEPPEREERAESRPRVVGFDHATQAYLVATVGRGDSMQAWIDVRTQGRVLKLQTGQRLRIGSVDGQIEEIGARFVRLATEEGSVQVVIGQRLTDAYAEVASK